MKKIDEMEQMMLDDFKNEVLDFNKGGSLRVLGFYINQGLKCYYSKNKELIVENEGEEHYLQMYTDLRQIPSGEDEKIEIVPIKAVIEEVLDTEELDGLAIDDCALFTRKGLRRLLIEEQRCSQIKQIIEEGKVMKREFNINEYEHRLNEIPNTEFYTQKVIENIGKAYKPERLIWHLLNERTLSYYDLLTVYQTVKDMDLRYKDSILEEILNQEREILNG